MREQMQRMEMLKSSLEISETTTGTTATSSDNDNDCDYSCTDEERRPRLHEPFYFDIDADDADRHFILPAAQEPPLSARDYSWDCSSQDSVTTISTWKSFELEHRNPNVKSRHFLEHDDNEGSAGRCEPTDSIEFLVDKGRKILVPGKSSRSGFPSLNRPGIPTIVKTGNETVWSRSLLESVQDQASDCEHSKLALFPTRKPHTPETFEAPLWRAITVPSVERVESDDVTPHPVMGPWIDFRLPENPFAPDSEFASYCDDKPHSPFTPIEQPPLSPKKASFVASPLADRPGFFSPSAISHSEKKEMSTKTPRDREQAVDIVTPAGSANASSIANRVPTQQAPQVKNTETKVGRRLCKRMPTLLRQSIVAPPQAIRDAVVTGSNAPAKPAKAAITDTKVNCQNRGPGPAEEQAFREKESTERRTGNKVVIYPVQVFAVNSVSRRQIIGEGTTTEMNRSDPVKSSVANSTSARPNVCQDVASDSAKSLVVNYKSGCQLLGQGAVAEQQRQEKDSIDSNKSACSTQRRAPLLLGHLLEERYQAARRKDVLPLRPVTAGEQNAESGELSKVAHSIQKNPALAKYARMLKVGLPISAVKNAMERDGVDPCVFDGGAPGPSTANKMELVSLKAARDPFRRFRLHWDTHSNVRSNTIWAMVSRDQDWLAEVQVDEEEVDTLFRIPKKSSGVAETSSTNRVCSDIASQVIDPKRANNGGISLARIKLSYRDMARAVESYDIAALTLEQMRGMLPYIPTPEETRDLQESIIKGGQPKTECEKFMVEIMSVDEAKRRLGKQCIYELMCLLYRVSASHSVIFFTQRLCFS
jgi:hypothetical protein